MDRPILMSGPLVRATLADQKTQTRRLLRVAIPPHWRAFPPTEPDGLWTMSHIGPQLVITCPYGTVGDRLWVRETWTEAEGVFYYRATDREIEPEERAEGMRWHPSIHMPRCASRLTLEIVAVRVERLQDLSEEDVLAEGIDYARMGDHIITIDGDEWATPQRAFASLWDAINGKRATWAANPWVWVISFQRVAQ